MAERDETTGSTTEEVVTVTAMATDGRGVARSHDGKVVFVEGALPGETVTARAVEERARYRSAVLAQVMDPSPGRMEPPCPMVAEGCGGCQWQHVQLSEQRRLKERIIADTLRRMGRIDDPPVGPTVQLDGWAFRTSFRLAVSAGRAALRRQHSHELVSVEGCLIAHPLIADLLSGPRYEGAVQVVVRAGAGTGERMATSDAPVPPDVPADVKTGGYRDRTAGREWRVSARSFFQTRTDGAAALAAVVAGAADAPGSGPAVDLYSGVGLFAGVLADRGWSVTAVEGSASSVGDSRVNLEGSGTTVVHADVNRWDPVPADLVVADPSRAGLGRGGVAAAVGTGARRVILVSCDVAALGRDAGLLAAAGYRLSSVTPVDLFPHSFHIEAVSVFDRD